MDTDKKDIIIRELETMSKKEAIGRNIYKMRAYNKVINQIKKLDKVQRYEDVENIEGIGKKIKDKIEEILRTGGLKSAERARETIEIGAYDEILKIHGIGVTKAKELVDKYGIKTIEELKRELEKNPSILNEKQKIGLEYYIDTQKRIPRKEITKHLRKISNITKAIKDKDKINIKIVGSYRRGLEDSGDIDILMKIDTKDINERNKIYKEFIDKLRDEKYLVADLGVGIKKYMGISKVTKKGIARRIDILLTTDEEYPYALLYFTGDFDINIEMRKRAREKGYILSEYGLKNAENIKKKLPKIRTEGDIFKFLGYKYLRPSDRKVENLKNI
jgi:DNA polymerase/3'-5' exonuclease PolX